MENINTLKNKYKNFFLSAFKSNIHMIFFVKITMIFECVDNYKYSKYFFLIIHNFVKL